MSIISLLLRVLAPYECLGCGSEGPLLCEDCIDSLRLPDPSCYRCGARSPDFTTCKSCYQKGRIARVVAASPYMGPAKDMLWKLKYGGSQDAAAVIARILVRRIRFPEGAVLVPVPTTSGRIRERGYDQAVLIAKALSRELRLPYADCLRRTGTKHQVGAGRRERIGQLQGAFRVLGHGRTPRAARIVLVDDVLTTGATLEAASRTLSKAGYEHVEGVVFLRA